MNVKVFDEILEKHVKTVIVPQMTKSLNRFLVGAAIGSGALRAETMRTQLEALGIMDEDDIDTEKLGKALISGFDQTPEVSFLGLTFDRDDAEALLRAFNVSGTKQHEVQVQ